jgi:hypothetical protein
MTAIAILVALGRVIYSRARIEAVASRCQNELKEIGLGILNHDSARTYLPNSDLTDPAGNVLSSWRFGIQPFLESSSWSRSFLSPWNAPVNRQPASVKYDVYCWDQSNPSPHTSAFGVTGKDTMFDGTRRTYQDVSGDLIVVIEVRDSKIHWMQPGDYKVADLLAYQGKIGDHLHGLLRDRLHVLFADGTVWALDANAPIAELQPFLTITGAKSHDRDQLLAPHKVD